MSKSYVEVSFATLDRQQKPMTPDEHTVSCRISPAFEDSNTVFEKGGRTQHLVDFGVDSLEEVRAQFGWLLCFNLGVGERSDFSSREIKIESAAPGATEVIPTSGISLGEIVNRVSEKVANLLGLPRGLEIPATIRRDTPDQETTKPQIGGKWIGSVLVKPDETEVIENSKYF